MKNSENSLPNGVGGRLKVIRQENDLTQAKMAKRLQISTNSYRLYENGARSIPTEVALTICEQFSVDLTELLTGERSLKIEDLKCDIQQVANAVLNLASKSENSLAVDQLAQMIGYVFQQVQEKRSSPDHEARAIFALLSKS